MTRNFGLRPILARQGMRCATQYKRDVWSKIKALILLAVIIACLIAAYGWMFAAEAKASAEASLNHTEKLLVSYMTTGAVQDEDTIYTCAAKAYELPKGI